MAKITNVKMKAPAVPRPKILIGQSERIQINQRSARQSDIGARRAQNVIKLVERLKRGDEVENQNRKPSSRAVAGG